ncbi:SOS response-associated peptidase [Xanthobacter autotrophicus]|uniref:SOS response-associated peptidase n=1 Tax=Xanthobacter autotrophicus TaxID=280 RepID=UPI001E340827|nr:SOS response-associated peptidase [Xanthobacter autotrophicus]UDQ91351.1 SOS response-associated peptidase [Xanthobacter autotrophicus]
MCGRFVQLRPPAALAALFGVDPTLSPLPNVPARYNAAPTQDLMVVRRNPETGRRHLDLLRWGLVPSFAKGPSGGASLINARSETVAEKPTFRAAWRARRRCIVPADAFYEWKAVDKRRQPFVISRADGSPMSFAGLWDGWKDPGTGQWLRTFTILTCPATERLRPLHERMPVILPDTDISAWLEGEEGAALMRSYPGEALRLTPVSTDVNSVRNEGPSLVEPLAPDEAAAAAALLAPSAV